MQNPLFGKIAGKSFTAGLALCGALAFAAMSPAMAAGNAKKGEKLAQQWCNSCHSVGGSGTERQADAGPQFAELAKKTPDYLKVAINKPHDFMPKFPDLSAQDKEDLIAYIRTVK